VSMIERYCGGIIPPATESAEFNVEVEKAMGASRIKLDNFDFSGATEEIWNLISVVDKFISDAKPWELAADHLKKQRLAQVLYDAAETVRIVAILVHPVIPDATQRIWEQLGQKGKLADVRVDQLEWGGLQPGTKMGKPEAVFPRVDKTEAYERIEAMEQEIRNPAAAAATSGTGSAAAGAAAAPGGAKISIEDFAKVELRVGVIKSAERIQGADKLLRILVDIGDEVRQVLAGIAMSYAPEDLAGRKVVVVTNLAPRKMRGLESNGMLLAAASGADGKPVLCTFAEDIAPGSKVK
jgi:methionyl-tRNA synthetase